MKYKNTDLESFYYLTWSTLMLGKGRTIMLASGGTQGKVRLFHPEQERPPSTKEWRLQKGRDHQLVGVSLREAFVALLWDQRRVGLAQGHQRANPALKRWCGAQPLVATVPWVREHLQYRVERHQRVVGNKLIRKDRIN